MKQPIYQIIRLKGFFKPLNHSRKYHHLVKYMQSREYHYYCTSVCIYHFVCIICWNILLQTLHETKLYYRWQGRNRLNLNEGYKCLNQLETNQTRDTLRDSTYLEPTFDERLHYNEIENQEEMSEPGIFVDEMKNQSQKVLQLCNRSKSCNFQIHVPGDSIDDSVKMFSCTLSL